MRGTVVVSCGAVQVRIGPELQKLLHVCGAVLQLITQLRRRCFRMAELVADLRARSVVLESVAQQSADFSPLCIISTPLSYVPASTSKQARSQGLPDPVSCASCRTTGREPSGKEKACPKDQESKNSSHDSRIKSTPPHSLLAGYSVHRISTARLELERSVVSLSSVDRLEEEEECH
ncbi:hypothetical protein AMS68_000073 [Peltaster fructicola]|uniref:Uncharacterized protein n=1 Tax=Peltaster fructicola TaxID=286661 RepID=A0A6H0XIL0_9PEZI|nr:hypothetical protein AMS68_000073 [Peltaster fructicola]